MIILFDFSNILNINYIVQHSNMFLRVENKYLDKYENLICIQLRNSYF